MALAKERTAQDSHSHMSLIQACSYYGGASVQETAGLIGFDNGDGDDHESTNEVLRHFPVGRLPSLTDPSNENGIMFGDLINSHQAEEAQVVINFKAGSSKFAHSYGPFLNFEQHEDNGLKTRRSEDKSVWRNAMEHSYPWRRNGNESRLSEDLNCFETASSSAHHNVRDGDEDNGWFYADGGAIESLEESTAQQTNSHKRPHMGGEVECRKKQHVLDGSRKAKNKIVASKDPQSIAAKNRRERISERLKILQDLVPNGSKVDLVTMLEKAISYVKFLQLQVKVLATDEFWPAQGGQAPEVSQVKEAIDAILSTHRDRSSGSN